MAYFIKNNASYGDGTADDLGVSINVDHNTWDGTATVSAADFVSLDPTGMGDPRQPDGSLPVLSFLHLAGGSDLIDVGTDVGLPFLGSAPDLGAFERQ